MRKLILLRGVSGSGKTHFLSQAGLSTHALSMDHLRLALGGPVLGADGRMSISQDLNARAFGMFRDLSEERMQRGELLALDATFTDTAGLKDFVAMAKKWRYEIACVDFSTVPEATIHRQNREREPERFVPEEVLAKHIRNLEQNPAKGMALLKGSTIIHWDAEGLCRQALRAWLEVPMNDFSAYERVAHIGDLQGCLSPLTGPGGVLEHGFDDKTLYMFMGDLFDRGLQNGEVGRWFVDHALDRDNVKLLWGNHELHLHLWARGLPAVSAEFERKTLPQLLAHGVTAADAERICQKAQEAIIYSFHGHKVLATHGGLGCVPSAGELARVSLRQLSHGTGRWTDPVDQQFERNAPAGWAQVHGHRNHAHQEIQASARSFNLEDAVEHGGNLRVATLSPGGWSVSENRNGVFLPARARGRAFDEEISPPWMSAAPGSLALSAAALAALRAHPMVYEKRAASLPHVASFEFSDRVFFEKSWDDVVVKARGLFVNDLTGEIIARGYDKFFNVNEKGRPEVQMPALADSTLRFPVSLYVKENGFLGNLGFDAHTQELVVCSKTTPDGPMAQLFRGLFERLVAPAAREGLRRYLRDNEACAVFEAIDPVGDPHLIDYAEPKIVLLDIFRRSEAAQKLPYKQLRAVARHFGLEAKELALSFSNAKEFSDWRQSVTAELSFRWKGRDVEGFVVEDSAGFMTKVKLPHYSFWKAMRSAASRLPQTRANLREALAASPQDPDAVAGCQEKMRRALQKDAHPLARAFLAWAADLPEEDLARDILWLRKRFVAERGLPAGCLLTPWERFDLEAMSRKGRKSPEEKASARAEAPRRKPSF